jgi:hypothetical protein
VPSPATVKTAPYPHIPDRINKINTLFIDILILLEIFRFVVAKELWAASFQQGFIIAAA